MKDIVAGHVEYQRPDVNAKMMVILVNLYWKIDFVIVYHIMANEKIMIIHVWITFNYNPAVEPELGALPIYDCKPPLICDQGANCTVAWKSQRVCGSVGTVVMACMKHFMKAAPRLCEAGEKGCICS